MTASRQCNRTSSGSSLLGRSDNASKDSACSNPIIGTADVSCSRISHICSLVPLGDEFNGFLVFMEVFRDFSRLAESTLLCSWCLACVACLDISMRLVTVRLMSLRAMSSSRCMLSVLVGFRKPVLIRQQSCRQFLCMCWSCICG